jgi:Domain of unknown function (DUF4328)
MELKPIRTLGDAVVFLLVAQVVVALAEAVALLHRIDVVRDAGSLSTDAVRSANNVVGVIALIDGLLFIATLVFWCIWQHHAQHNALLLTSGGLGFTPGWAVGWWFIPIANLWKPWQAVRELWKASHGGDAWHRIATWPVLGWWWAVWIASLIHVYVGGISLGTMPMTDPAAPSDVLFNDKWLILSLALRVGAAFLAIKIVQAIVELQEHAPRRTAEPLGVAPLPDLPPPPPDTA